MTRLRSSFCRVAIVSTAEITSVSKRILTAARLGCIGGRPAPGRGPPSLVFFLVEALVVLLCFGAGILENGTETQTQEQYSSGLPALKVRERESRNAWRKTPPGGEITTVYGDVVDGGRVHTI